MVYRLIGADWQEVNGIKDIKKGDIFRTKDGEGLSPVYKAMTNAKEVIKNGKKVWSVKPKIINSGKGWINLN